MAAPSTAAPTASPAQLARFLKSGRDRRGQRSIWRPRYSLAMSCMTLSGRTPASNLELENTIDFRDWQGVQSTWSNNCMDSLFTEAIRHEVAVKAINVRHLIDVSPATLSIAREVRYCVIAIVVGWASASIIRSVLSSRRPPQS